MHPWKNRYLPGPSMMKSIGPCVKSKRWNCWRTTGAFAVSGISASQGRYWFYCRGKQRFGQTPRDRFLSNKKAGAFVRGLGLDVIASHDLLADRIRRKWIFELYARPRFLRRSRNFGIAPDNALSDHCGGDFGFQHEGDCEKTRACEGSIELVPGSFADIELHWCFVSRACAVPGFSAVVERFESGRWIIFKRNQAVSKNDSDFSARVHEYLRKKCWKLPYHLNITESTIPNRTHLKK